MKHTELSRDQVRSQLVALRTRRAKPGNSWLLFCFMSHSYLMLTYWTVFTENVLWKCFYIICFIAKRSWTGVSFLMHCTMLLSVVQYARMRKPVQLFLHLLVSSSSYSDQISWQNSSWWLCPQLWHQYSCSRKNLQFSACISLYLRNSTTSHCVHRKQIVECLRI